MLAVLSKEVEKKRSYKRKTRRGSKSAIKCTYQHILVVFDAKTTTQTDNQARLERSKSFKHNNEDTRTKSNINKRKTENPIFFLIERLHCCSICFTETQSRKKSKQN
jgi:hypothetical protein